MSGRERMERRKEKRREKAETGKEKAYDQQEKMRAGAARKEHHQQRED